MRIEHIIFLSTTVILGYQIWLLIPRSRPLIDELEHITTPGIKVRRNIWADLTDQEARDVIAWLHNDTVGLNITSAGKGNREDDFIYVTEILRPNKTDAIAFLDQEAAMPTRYCRVTVKRNSQEPPQIEEYMVGPLPLNSRQTEVRPLSFVYNSGRSVTRNPTPDIADLLQWIDAVADEVADIVQDLLGNSLGLEKLTEKDFEASSNDQVWIENDRTMRWVTFFQRSSASTMLPQGLYFKADTTGRDSRKWQIVSWLYNGKIYPNTKAFREAWSSPDFERLPANLDGIWTKLEPDSIPADNGYYSTEIPPSVHQQGPSRVFIDDSESFVSWMGFTFSLAFSQVNALSIYDIRLDGERVIYELSLQEAMAHYAGNDPIQSGTAFLDSLFGLGTTLSELVPGFDCPEYAHFMDTKHHRMERTYRRSNAICIFESPLDYPLQRHSRGPRITSYANSILIVRMIAVIGNYDYLIDYTFYLDGSIEVKVRASGYIQGAFAWNNSDYGYHIHEHFSSSIHDHVINFKVDLDVGGTKNNFSIMTVAEQNVSYPWSMGPRNTMVLNRSQVENENTSAMNWPANGASMYVITGENNIFGEKRGYRIMPGTGMGSPIHLTTKHSSNLLNAADWAKYDIFVTKQKDTEPRSASPANALTPEDPLIRFDNFLDGESLVNEDLVVWFNLGNHHVPHTGDIPNTLMSTSASSVMLSPHNYHLRDRSRALTSGVSLFLKQDGSTDALYFGPANGSLANFTASPRPIRKFPSDDSELSL